MLQITIDRTSYSLLFSAFSNSVISFEWINGAHNSGTFTKNEYIYNAVKVNDNEETEENLDFNLVFKQNN